jgi:UDP-N-acetylglucosamine/UDP-N-acetylgalactosamine diphosphorylase
VGVVLVAGGQGTRLGFEHPKGMFPIGPVSGASLFRIHFEKIRAAADRSGCSIPLYVMTSDATDDETRSYLAEHKQFGMPESDVIVFRQGAMPAVDAASGKLLLSEPGSLCLSPDGHGGMLAAMHRGGVLRDAARRGLRQLFYFQVDNALAPVCDAAMLGYHLLARSELTTLVVAKRDAAQRVGNVVSIDGVVQIIEYSDLPDEAAQRRTSDGELQLWAGNIAVHIFDVELMQRAAADAESLPFHIAEKKVPHLDAAGRRVAPSKPNALKFERFIFDLLPAAKNALVVEGDPGEIFAPLKNAPGEASDTEAHVQHRMAALHRQWLTAAGVAVAPETPVEISPLFALDAEELARKVDGQLRIDAPTYLET